MKGRIFSVFLAGLLSACAPTIGSSTLLVPSSPSPYAVNAEVDSKGTSVTLADFLQTANTAAGVCLGEAHDDSAHHHLHARLVEQWGRAAKAAGRELAVGFEMFDASRQPPLDAFATGVLNFPGLLDASDWRHRWGWDPVPYEPLFEAARSSGAQLLALNAPRELTKKVARGGLASLPPAVAVQVPALVLDDEEHRQFFAASMGNHGGAGLSENFYIAQVIWDETMAARADAWLAAGTGKPRLVVLIAGNGHCHDSAIPRRLARRLAARGAANAKVLSVLTRTHGGELPPLAASDYVLTVDGERMAKHKKNDTPPVERFGDGVISRNRRAAYDFELGDTYEAGLQLVGSEVKVLRAGKADLSEAYVTISHNEAFLHAANIPEQGGMSFGHEAKRKRKLLLNRDEIDAIERATEREGMTVVATKIYFRGGRAKVEIALARGKKHYDKRETLKRKEADREARAAIAGRRG